jgi:HAD superfamily hydrolase (TIGR01509 family)
MSGSVCAMVEGVIFDMDGLMIDSERLYFQAEREIGRRFGREVREETLWKMMGRKPEESIEIFVEEVGIPMAPGEVLEMRDRLMRGLLQGDLVAMPGLDHIIGTFEKRLKLAIATGAPREFVDIAVDKLKIREKFAVLQSSDEIERGKPDPEIYVTTCRKLGIAPAHCVVLEDSENGVAAGKGAGCYVIAVPSAYTEKQDFSRADFIARDLFQAQGHISELIDAKES